MALRFYLADLKERPAYWGDLGHRITIAGVVLQGAERRIVLHMPESTEWIYKDGDDLYEIKPTLEEWAEIIRHSDDPEIFEHDKTGQLKAIHRKIRYSISGFTQQKVWVADGLKCQFCDRQMGDIQLTVDHFMPLDLGGRNVEKNYLSACRKCNKQKGGAHPKQWCEEIGRNYQDYLDYLEKRKI